MRKKPIILISLGSKRRETKWNSSTSIITIWFQTKTRIGGTKTPDFDKIKALTPDLIIGNKEENTKEQIEQLFAIADSGNVMPPKSTWFEPNLKYFPLTDLKLKIIKFLMNFKL